MTLAASPVQAADHRDGGDTGVLADPSTDINDVYSWMSADGSKVYLIMTVSPAATAASRFSNAAYYVFHTASRAAFGSPAGTVPFDIVCAFDAAVGNAQKIRCWFGSDKTNFVYGDASAPAGLSAVGGKAKIFAGLRKDHFFFNLDGFNAVRTYVTTNAASLPAPDAAQCRVLTAAQSTAIVTQLQKSPAGAAPVDFFASLSTLAIVMEVDKTLLNAGGNIFSVWAGTHAKTN